MYCTMWGIQPIFYDNYKQSIIFKDCDSLHCTPETYIKLYIKYTTIKKKGKSNRLSHMWNNTKRRAFTAVLFEIKLGWKQCKYIFKSLPQETRWKNMMDKDKCGSNTATNYHRLLSNAVEKEYSLGTERPWVKILGLLG